MRRAAALRFALIACAGLLLAACAPPEPTRQESYVFGTRIEIRLAGPETPAGRAAVADVLREFDRLHRTYHAWQPSDLSTLNAALAAGKAHEVSAELAALIVSARELAASGEFLFDPGIGRLIGLWGFQSDEIAPRLPAEPDLSALLAQRPSIADIAVAKGACAEPRNDEPVSASSGATAAGGGCVTSRNKSVALDFGGYLKGVALDRAAAILKTHGVKHALVNIGGNILALGNREARPEGKAWRVGIQHPRPAAVGNVPLASMELRDGEAIGTSGDYHRFFTHDGRRYCHLIDPRDGRPHTGTQSLTILIPPGTNAGTRSDALSKPLFISGERWLTLAGKLGIDAVLKVGADGTALATPAMKARITIEAPDTPLKEAR